jgi:hypothetical protein
VAATPGDGVAVAGWTSGALDYGAGPVLTESGNYAYVSKLDSSGAHQWSRKLDESPADSFWGSGGVTADSSGNLVTLSERGRMSNDPIQDSNVAKFSSGGDLAWKASSSGQFENWTGSIGTDRHDNVLEFGSFHGTLFTAPHQLSSDDEGDMFIIKRSPAGKTLWTTRVPGTGSDFAYGVKADANANVIVAGLHFQANVSVFMSRFSP